jgi:hypothetical protein
MLPAILYIAIRWWARKNPRHAYIMRKRFIQGGRIVAYLLAGLIVVKSLKAQDEQLNYSVYRNDAKVGALQVQCHLSPGKVHYKLESTVKTRFIILFNASAKEESIFENGRMVFSSIYRKVNGHEKVNRKTELHNNLYMVSDFSSVQTKKSFVVPLNTHGLYFREPSGYGTVYSENFQRLLPVIQKGDHAYELDLPDGSVNTYYYRDGICFQIEVHSPLFNAKILLDDPATKDYSKH